MQLPISADRSSSGSPLLHGGGHLATAGAPGRACAGPPRWGSSVREVDLDDPVEVLAGVVVDLGVGASEARWPARSASSPRPGGRAGSPPCAASKGKTEVVAPSSAPMLVMVALPVQEMASHAGAEVLDDGVGAALHREDAASLRMTSLGEVQPSSAPVSRTPMSFGCFTSQGKPAMTSTASAPPTPRRPCRGRRRWACGSRCRSSSRRGRRSSRGPPGG